MNLPKSHPLTSTVQPTMATAHNESEPSILTEPFLPPSPDSDEPHAYLHGRRPLRDVPALILFALLSLSTFAFGVVALARRNPDRTLPFVFDRATSSCLPIARTLASSNRNLAALASSPFWRDLVGTLVVTVVLAGPIALGLLWLLRRFAKQVVYASIPFFIIVPAFLNIYWFVACIMNDSCHSAFPLAYRILVLAFVFALIGIIIWIIVSNWHRVELTVFILRVASAALTENLWLLVVLPALGIGLIVYFVPIIVFLVYSTWNGQIVPKAVEGSSGQYYKCIWKEEGWVPAYFALAIMTMIWSATTLVEAKVFVISGTIAQWYFSKEGEKPNKSIRSSLRNAFGPSFGTVCFSGMVIGVVRFIRAVVDSAKEKEVAPGIVNALVKYCADFLLAAVDFVNKFTINFAAITGKGYCSSAKLTYELLKRNLLSAVFVETVSTRILIGIIFVLSTLYAAIACAVLHGVSALGEQKYLVSALAWLLLIVVLGYFVHVLDKVIDTIYICYAIDKDKGEVSKQQVHEVYALLPLSRNPRSTVNSPPMLV